MDNKDTDDYSKAYNFWESGLGFSIIAALVIIMWLSNYFIMPIIYSADDLDLSNAGAAGDMFGGLTALFSGLAFAGLITTLFMQRIELALQRNEIKQTRDVFKMQQFENTYFGLLKLLNDHVNSLEVPTSEVIDDPDSQLPETYIGRRALAVIANELPHPKETQIGKFGYRLDSTDARSREFE